MTNSELARQVLHELELVWADRVAVGQLENDTYAAGRLEALFDVEICLPDPDDADCNCGCTVCEDCEKKA